jgi:hypothetical protein
MVKPPENPAPESWHRFFASDANNRAWELAELPAEDTDPRELLNAAHAAAWHWQQVGTELNRMRALMLLAMAHAKVGLGATALAYANEMRSYFLSRSDTPDWEVAFTHVVHAHAASVAGAQDQHARSYTHAVEAVAAIVDEEDRAIVRRVFRHVPSP